MHVQYAEDYYIVLYRKHDVQSIYYINIVLGKTLYVCMCLIVTIIRDVCIVSKYIIIYKYYSGWQNVVYNHVIYI